VSIKIQLQDVVGSTVGVKSGSGSSKRVEVETVPVVDPVLAFSGGGLIMPGEGKIEKIRVERSLEPN